MSHFSKINTRIKEKQILVRCLQELGYQIKEGGAIRGFQGMLGVEIAVRMSQGYDIGFMRGGQGYYEMVADWWGVQGVSREQLTTQLDSVVRRYYATKVASEQLLNQGFVISERTQLKDGSVRIVARRWR